jgi:hypothetical protein
LAGAADFSPSAVNLNEGVSGTTPTLTSMAKPAGLTGRMRLGSLGAPPIPEKALPWAKTSPAATF